MRGCNGNDDDVKMHKWVEGAKEMDSGGKLSLLVRWCYLQKTIGWG